MTLLQPFFLLMARASVFWVGAATLVCLSILLAGLSQPEELPASYVNAALLATFGFPAAAGWVAGAVIQEFQHSTFAWALPGVRKRLALGFLITGIVAAMIVAALASQSASAQNHPLLLVVIGLAGYCIGGTLLNPLHRWLTSLSLILVLILVVRSRHLSALAAQHPWWAATVATGIGLLGLSMLFARSTFRRKPFIPTSPFPGSHSLERSVQYEREKLAKDGPRNAGWRAGYLGTGTWSWVRAAIHEAYGPLGWRTISRVLNRFWVLGLLFVIYAWSDKGDLSFGESLGKTIHHSLFNPPHEPPFGEKGGAAALVILVIAAAGAALALMSPAALKTTLAYPLSRQRIARITHRAELVDAAVFFLGIFSSLSIVGLLAGWLVGYQIRFDFVPSFLRPLAATVTLMPLAHWGRLHLQVATQRKTENTLVAVIFGIIGFVAVVWVWSAASPRLLANPLVELTVAALLFLLSHDIYRRKLRNYFSVADLV